MTSGRLAGPFLLTFLLVATGCTGSSSGGSDREQPLVVATTTIWADIVMNVACEEAIEVESLIPPGGDPHTYEPSLADRGRLESSDFVIANGLGLEYGIDDTLDAVDEAGTPVIRVAPLVTGAVDPHVWFDPTAVALALPFIADALVEHAGLQRGGVDACVASYSDDLADLDVQVFEMVDSLPVESRKLVTNHDSLGYFADRYGFEILGTVIPSPSGLAEANPADLAALAQTIENEDVPVIFAETQHSADDAEALANEVGDVEVVTLETGTLGPPGSPSDTYVEFLLSNASTITDSLR